MKLIKLTQGYYTMVDDSDYEWLNKYKWHVAEVQKGSYYAAKYGPKNSKIFMHRLILNTKKNKLTDHIDGDGLNNQRSNLRLCTHSQNMKNRKSKFNSTSKYLGVCYHIRMNRWYSSIGTNRKIKYLGVFKSEIRAAIEYDKAAIIYHGKFANLNILKVKAI